MQHRTADIIKYFFFNVLIIVISVALGWYLNSFYYVSHDLKPVPYPQSRLGQNAIYYYKNLTCFNFGDATLVELADTHSMEPTMGHTTLAIKKQVPVDTIKTGDIISFNWIINGKPDKVIHRVIDIKNNKFITKGDNIKMDDGVEIDPKDVTGVIVALIY